MSVDSTPASVVLCGLLFFLIFGNLINHQIFNCFFSSYACMDFSFFWTFWRALVESRSDLVVDGVCASGWKILTESIICFVSDLLGFGAAFCLLLN